MIPNLYIAGAIALAGFGSGWAVNGWRLGSAITKCESKAANLSSSLTEQNARVEHLAQISDKARAEAESARLAAEKAEGEAKVAEKARRASIASGKGPATCSAAIAAQRAELRP